MNARRAVLLAAVLLALASAAGCTASPRPATTVASSPATGTASTAQRGTDDHDEDEGSGDAPSTAPAPQALRTAEQYVRAWARPDLDARTWLAGVTPYVTPAYRDLLTTVEPGNIPARAVTGPPTVVSSTTAVVVTDVATDTGAVRVTCVNTAGRWLVATVDPAERARE